MTSTLLVLVSQAGGADSTFAEAVTPPLPASSTGGWRYQLRLEAAGLALLPVSGVDGHMLYALAEGGPLLFPEADGALRPGASATLGLGVDNAG